MLHPKGLNLIEGSPAKVFCTSPLIRSSLNIEKEREAAAPNHNSIPSQTTPPQSGRLLNHKGSQRSDDAEAQGANCSRRYAPWKTPGFLRGRARHALKDMRVVFAHVLRQETTRHVNCYICDTHQRARLQKVQAALGSGSRSCGITRRRSWGKEQPPKTRTALILPVARRTTGSNVRSRTIVPATKIEIPFLCCRSLGRQLPAENLAP